ncbi:LPS O-antigen length regulator [Marinomonas agarivorans]|nr:LPS O-antigen length regulator [Marinomonas agarivorans]
MSEEIKVPLQAYQQDDEIDLKELFVALWKGKWIILLLTIVCATGGVFYALSQPNVYKAEAVLASAGDGGSNGLSAIKSQFGGLASLAGISLEGGGADNKAIALAVLQSRQFINAFIHKYDLLVPLMAGKEWSAASGELQLNEELYDSAAKTWIREVQAGKSQMPTEWEAYKSFKEIFEVTESKDNGLMTLSVTYFSPILAKQWVDSLVVELNAWMKDKSLKETQDNIDYLEEQIQRTKIADMQSVFYQLIEEQTKNLMLAEVQTEFAFKVIDPAVVPEEKAGPKRALICIVAVLSGGMLGIMIILVRFAFRSKE